MDVFAKSSVGVQNRPNGCPLPKQLTCVCRSVRTAAAPGLHQIFYPFDFFHDAYDFLQIFIVVAAEWDTASLALHVELPFHLVTGYFGKEAGTGWTPWSRDHNRC